MVSTLTSRCLVQLLHKCHALNSLNQILGHLTVLGLLKTSLSVRNILSHYSSHKKRALQVAIMVLREVDIRDSLTWNSTIREYERNGFSWEAIYLYHQMLNKHIIPDKFTYPFVLKACTNAVALKEGEQIHCRITKSPHRHDVFVECSLIDMYAKCGRIEAARTSFDNAQNKNVFCWNVMLDGYVKHGDMGNASQLFNQMPDRDLFSWNVMIDGHAKSNQVKVARQLFDEMMFRDRITWNSMIDGYVRCGNMEAAKELFMLTPSKDALSWGIMINGYAKCGYTMLAHSLFEKLPYRNSITWNSLLHGYARTKNIMDTKKLFELMECKNLTSWNIMLDACVKGEDFDIAEQFFNKMPDRDVTSWNIMIDGCARAGKIEFADKLFYSMPRRDLVSWNSILVGHRKNGQPKKVIEIYRVMQSAGQKPDDSTLATVLCAIADLGLSDHGRWIHIYTERNKISVNGIIGVALIDMYCKCGYVDFALEIFKSIPHKTIDHWNSIISGSAIHGLGNLAISLFKQMEQSIVQPDAITFIAILNACSHAGFIHEGHMFFELMHLKYGIFPNIQHYGCMVDLLSRAGYFDAAITLVNNMPFQPNDVIWRVILGASCNHSNKVIAEHSSKQLIDLMPQDSSSYILLSNIYGSIGILKNARNIWKVMKKRGVVKTPGCSSIELNGCIHEFTVGDISYPKFAELHILLNRIFKELITENINYFE